MLGARLENTEGTGERVGGYRVVRRLATGGTCDVLLATAEGAARAVVLKVLRAAGAEDPARSATFEAEAAAYARLSHRSIVGLLDSFTFAGRFVMVFEDVEGPQLDRLRGMLKTVGQQLDDRGAIYVGGTLFEALAIAHGAVGAAGEPAAVIHRDVNPSNVLVTWDGQVKLTDFGIANVTGSFQQRSAGLIKGTYGYAAPEQVKGQLVTPRADVYAGAVILWELLTKRRAFLRGALPEAEVMRALAEPRIVSIDVLRPDLDAGLRDALKRALDPRSERRSVTAEEMHSTLRAIEPEASGRLNLVRTLTQVRHEPRAAMTSMPPPLGDAEDATTRLIPRLSQVPRPAATGMTPSVPRVTTSYGARPVGGATPSPPVYTSPPRSRSLEKEMPAATLSPEEVALVMEQGSVAAPVPAGEPLPASVKGLASILEPSPGERARAGVNEAFARTVPGRALGAAIDEILGGSLAPPPARAATQMGVGSRVRSDAETRKDAKTIQDTLELGHTAQVGELLDAPSRPQTSAPPRVDRPPTAVTPIVPPPIPSSFPQMSRTLAMNERVDMSPSGSRELGPQGRDGPAPETIQTMTAPMRAVPPRPVPPSSSATLLMEARPSATPPPPAGPPPLPPPLPVAAPAGPPPLPPQGPRASSPSAYESSASYPPMRPPLPSASSAHPAPTVRTSAQPTAPATRASDPPVPRGSSLPLVALLLVALLAGGVGTFGYVRWRRTQAIAALPVPLPPVTAIASESASSPASSRVTTAPGDVAAPTVANAGANAETMDATIIGSDASDVPAVTGGAAPSSSAAVAAGARAAAASAAPPSSSLSSEDIPAGMGRVRTTGTVPGRRIFVDERAVGQTPDTALVKCGIRKIKLGSAGFTRTLEVPCGGELTVGDR